MAPSVSPSSRARAVPMAWLQAPMASPAATGSFTRKRRASAGAHRLPRMPVKITAATVMETMPPCPSAMAVAMGVVTDLGRRETVSVRSRPNRRHRPQMLRTEVTAPAAHPARMGSRFFFSRSIWA